MILRNQRRARPLPVAPVGDRRAPASRRGQALVEFAAVLLPVLLVVVGIIQFGLLFGANVTLTNAAREGARAGTIYVYSTPPSNAQNGVDRCGAILEAATQAFGFLSAQAPSFSVGSSCPTGTDLTGDGAHDLWQNGDLEVSICGSGVSPADDCPTAGDSSTYCTKQAGTGCLVRVRLTYNSPIVVPLLDAILDNDGDRLFTLTAEATMVIN